MEYTNYGCNIIDIDVVFWAHCLYKIDYTQHYAHAYKVRAC